MKKENEVIIRILKAMVLDKECILPKYDIDWDYIYRISKEQNISGLLYHEIKKMQIDSSMLKRLSSTWELERLQTISINIARQEEFLRMNKIARENGIKLVALKGAVVKDLYPVPELRTMGDFDVLINIINKNEVKELFSNEGYAIESLNNAVNARKKNIYWEIFNSLDEEYITNVELRTDEVFNNVVKIKTDVLTTFPTYSFAFIIAHTSKDFKVNGAGIRNLIDLALFWKNFKNEIDFKYIKSLMKEQGYLKIYYYIMSVLSSYFELDINDKDYEKQPESKTEIFFNSFFENGIHGNVHNIEKKQGKKKIRNFINVLFPGVERITRNPHYLYVRKNKYLLPFAWIHRIFYNIKKNKYTIKQIRNVMIELNGFDMQKQSLFNELGIK